MLRLPIFRFSRSPIRRLWPVVVGSACLALLCNIPRLTAQATALPVAVATENAQATELGLRIMKQGGNAVDAAVTAALAAGVASPTSSGIGGGGFALVHLPGMKSAFVLDFRETAPEKLDARAFEKRPLPWEQRGRLIGVPGEVKGLFTLHRRFGKLPWNQVVLPAQVLAERGFLVNEHLATMLSAAQPTLTKEPALARLFYARGLPLARGHRVKNPRLAQTLARVAKHGPGRFYSGFVAEDVVKAARAAHSQLTLEDLRDYQVVEREPLHARYAGYEVFTMPPPSAGGLMLVQTLKLFKPSELLHLGQDSGAYQHLLAEGMRAALADRIRYVGDPAFEKDMSVKTLLDDARLAKRRKRIVLDRTHAIPRFGLDEHGTHHLVTADAQGGMVSLTTTINRLFGAKVVADASGVTLNDELNDFTANSDMAAFGLKQSPNRARPGARPVSSMTPTIVVKNGRAVMALGGSGGMAIATNVTQVLLGSLVFGQTPEQAVAHQRFYVPTSGAFILLEEGAGPALAEDLRRRGEIVGTMRFKSTAVQMVSALGNQLEAASDPRKHGTARVSDQ